ncbi:MAG: hypothetical protein ACRD2R_01405, partial [Terriglobales bacterium]
HQDRLVVCFRFYFQVRSRLIVVQFGGVFPGGGRGFSLVVSARRLDYPWEKEALAVVAHLFFLPLRLAARAFLAERALPPLAPEQAAQVSFRLWSLQTAINLALYG